MVYLLALTTAVVNAVASILQRLGVEDAPSTGGLGTHLIAYMLKRTVWIMGFVLMALGFVAQAIALHLGSLTEVQPVLVTELVFIVAALGLWFSMPVRPRDLVGSAAAAGGVAAFLVAAAPHAGTRVPSDARWLVVGVVIVALGVGAIIVGLRGPSWWRALWLGVAASVGFSLVAALTKSMTNEIAHGVASVFTNWPLYALAVMGLGSFVVMQHAFQAGPFAASQSTLILVNPFASIIIGAALFGDRIATSPGRLAAEVVALGVMVGGGVALSTSPLIVGIHDEVPGTSWLAGRGRWARYRQRRASTA